MTGSRRLFSFAFEFEGEAHEVSFRPDGEGGVEDVEIVGRDIVPERLHVAACAVAQGYLDIARDESRRNYRPRPPRERNDEMEKLLRFAGKVISATHVEDIGDLDGGEAQDIAEECGLLAPHEVTEACGFAECRCREYGFPVTCYRLTALGERAVGSLAAVPSLPEKQRPE